MKITDIQNVQIIVDKAYKEINDLVSNYSLEMVDLAYPNHDGVQDKKAVGELLYLRQSVNSLKNASEILIEKLNDAIQDSLEYEIIKTGFRYRDNGDNSYDVCYDHEQDSFFERSSYHVATIREDGSTWYIDNNCGLGEGEYQKKDWSLIDAIKDQCGE